MAEVLVIDGTRVKRRSPTGIRVLTLVTLTVCRYVWYFKINDEAHRYRRDDSIKPWRSVLAMFPGFSLLFIPVFRAALHHRPQPSLVVGVNQHAQGGAPGRLDAGCVHPSAFGTGRASNVV